VYLIYAYQAIMSFLKKTIDRAKQTVDEKFGSAEKTELDPELQRMLVRADDIRVFTEKILASIEAYVQPDASQRLLPNMMVDGQNKAETIGQEMSTLGTKLGASDAFGKVNAKGGEIYYKIGASEKEFLALCQSKFVLPVKRFLGEEMKALDVERKDLATKRLDMDALKAKAKAASKPDPALEGELAKANEAYFASVANVRTRVSAIDGKLPDLQKHLKEFVEAELELYAKKTALLGELKKAL